MTTEREGSKPYQEILETVPDMVYVMDSEFQFTYINDAVVEVTGYDREEVMGSDASLLLDEEALKEGEWNRDQLKSGNIEFGGLETKLKTAGNGRIPCEIRGQLFDANDDGTRTGTAGIIRDITDRKERERELQSRSTAMRASIDGMAILDTEQQYVFVNQSHADIYGYPAPDALLGETWRICYPEDELTQLNENVLPKLFDDGEWRGETVGVRKDGSRFPQELSLSLTENGRVICVVRDITDRKRREQELKQKKEQLEEFAGVVSHDLRNPLNVAQGRLELAQEEFDSEHLEPAANAIDRCLTLVDDLLTLSREGVRTGELEPVDLSEIATDCWQNVATAQASLIVETEQTIRADRSRLKELLENLLRNAVEHGGDDVAVTISAHDDGFYVADDGSGIPDGKQDAIFETGYTTATEGTGFGLDIVEKIADAHGWEVQVTDSESGGARFEFTSIHSPP
ncbi:PAS domain-containing sensor histidine kinase [Halorubrum sp. SS5]|nr:PAS domain-containing sensor histidine kinase [Halorubrum sp. SS5]